MQIYVSCIQGDKIKDGKEVRLPTELWLNWMFNKVWESMHQQHGNTIRPSEVRDTYECSIGNHNWMEVNQSESCVVLASLLSVKCRIFPFFALGGESTRIMSTL